MYKINETTIALEKGDKLTIVRDGGGSMDLCAGDEAAMKDPETGPRIIERAERMDIDYETPGIGF